MSKTPISVAAPSHFAVPRISRSCWPVVQRNLLVWKKLALPSLLGNIAEPLIILVAFGYGLGALVGRVNDLPYILFLASGSICMSTMYAASFEAMYSAYSRMQVQKTWESILNAPIALDDIVFAEMLWAGIKALISASAIAAVLFALDISRAPTLLLALPVLFLVGLTFAAIALVFNAMAKGYDFFTYYFTLVLTPMTFLSGVYFPVEHLPAWLQSIAAALPLSAAVEIVRPLVIGEWPASWLRPLAVLLAYCGAGYWVALVLTRKRFYR
jgi:lipooligosaccharide transport system permease protein